MMLMRECVRKKYLKYLLLDLIITQLMCNLRIICIFIVKKKK